MKALTVTQKISKYFSLSVTALVAVLAMTGCGSKSNNNNGGIVNGGFGAYPCTQGCTGGNALIASATATSGLEDLYVHFTGNTATSTPYQTMYNGQASIQGFMLVNVDSPMTCGLVRGQYTIQPAQPGAMQGASVVSTIYAIATGPTQVQMEFTPRLWLYSSTSRIGPDGQQYGYRMGGTIVVRGQQGQACAIEIN